MICAVQLFVFGCLYLTYHAITDGPQRARVSIPPAVTLSSCLSVVITNLFISPRFSPCEFLSRYKFSTLTTRQPIIDFYLLTCSRFPLRMQEKKSCFDKNRTHDFRTTSRCARGQYIFDIIQIIARQTGQRRFDQNYVVVYTYIPI